MMILYRNTNNQTVYSRAVSITGGAHNLVPGLSGQVENGLTAHITKNGGNRTGSKNFVREVGDGVYSLILSQDETNCDTGVVNIVVGTTGWYLFDPIYFQTHQASLTASASSTDVISSSVRGATYDGNITQGKLNEMLLSFLFGAISLTSESGINTYSFKNSSGATSFVSYCLNSNGTRNERGVTG